MNPIATHPYGGGGRQLTLTLGGSLPPPICQMEGQSAEKKCGGGRRAHSLQCRHVNRNESSAFHVLPFTRAIQFTLVLEGKRDG